MKANELMIGDWVRNALLNEVFKMNTTSMRNMCWDEDNGMARYAIEPIPITEEILKVNGFGKNFSERYTKAIVPFEVVIRGNNKYITLGGKYFCYFDYVHELQHALRLCKLDELADNFKVN